MPDGNCQLDLFPLDASDGITAAVSASPDNFVSIIDNFARSD
jgi:hypothetical protein